MKQNIQNITTEDIKAARAKYDSYGSEWEKAYFDEKSGGYVVSNKLRIEHSKLSKNEKMKYDKEFEMSLVLFQFDKMDGLVLAAIDAMKKRNIKGMYFVTGKEHIVRF